MKRKYIKRTYCLTFMCLFLIFSCQNKKTIANHKKGELVLASGGKYYGGVFRINETEYFRSLYPLNITEVVSHRIINQVYEGLVSLNHVLQERPGRVWYTYKAFRDLRRSKMLFEH